MAALLLVGAGFYWYSGNDNSYDSTQAGTLSLRTGGPLLPREGSISVTDEDGDGLKDWEEALWKTDPKNPDTDGDGSYDGDEVALGRDPMNDSPNDTIVKTEEGESREVFGIFYPYEYDETGEINNTEALAVNITENYLRAKATGQNIQVRQNMIANSVASAIEDIDIGLGELSSESLSITDDVNKERVEKYLSEVGKIMLDEIRDPAGNETEIIIEMAVSQDFSRSGELRLVASRYNQAATSLMSVEVPVMFAQQHTFLTDSLFGLATAVADMSQSEVDPMTAIVGTQHYALSAERFAFAFNWYRKFVSDNKENLDIGERDYSRAFVKLDS